MTLEKTEITVLSFGAGYGSVGLSLMLKDGVLSGVKKPDLAVFSDTMAEPPHVYETVEKLKSILDYPVIVVSAGDLRSDLWTQIRGDGPTLNHRTDTGFIDIPAYTETGIVRRQCTTAYKINVIKRAVRNFAGVNPPKLKVTQYLGISLDEASRMKDSRVKYITNEYPLVENRVTRTDIVDYLNTNYPDIPVGRSACFFCPFHSISEWQEIRDTYPALYEEAVEMERALITMDRGPFYLHKSKYGAGLEEALANVNVPGKKLVELDQFQNECEGHCGV